MSMTTLLERAVSATATGSAHVLVVGVGDVRHRDDAVGPAVIERLCRAGLAVPQPAAVAASLRELWRRAELAIVVAGARNDPAHPGRIHMLATDRPAAAEPGAQVVDELTGSPRRVVVYAVEGAAFTPGRSLTPEVAAAADRLTDRIAHQLSAEATDADPGRSRRRVPPGDSGPTSRTA